MFRSVLLAGSMLAGLIGLSSPAFASDPIKVDWTRPEAYSEKSIANHPSVREPNMRLKNWIAAQIQRVHIRRGVETTVAAGAAAAVTYVMGVVNQQYASDQSLIGSVTGTALDFASGCAAGGILGSLGGPKGAAAGCVVFGVGYAIFGTPATSIPLDEEGKIIAQKGSGPNAPITLTGLAILPGTLGPRPNDGQMFGFVCNPADAPFYVTGPCTVPANMQHTMQSVYQQYGLNRTFTCYFMQGSANSWSVGSIRACVFVPTLRAPDGTWEIPNDPARGTFTGTRGTAVIYPNGGAAPRRVGALTHAECAGGRCFIGTSGGPLQNQTVGASQINLFISDLQYQQNTDVPHQQVETLEKRPLWAEFLGGKIDQNTAQLKLSNELLAAMVNDYWKRSGHHSWNPADPVTVEDVQQLKIARPDLIPRIGDLVRPHDFPGLEEQPASETNPARPALPVTITNPTTGTNTGTGTPPKPSDYELKLTGAEPPALPDLPSVSVPGFSFNAGQCPTFNLGVSFDDPAIAAKAARFGIIADRPVDWMCGPLESNADWLRPLLLMLIGFHAFVIFRN